MTVNLRGNKQIKLKNALLVFKCIGCLPSALRYYRAFFDRHSYIDFKNYIMFLCMYAYAMRILQGLSPKALLVANDHSPIPLGFACAARKLGVKVLYIQHAHITYDLPYLRFDLAILDGECALDIYKEQGSIGDTQIVYRGLEGEQRVMNTQPLLSGKPITIGLFVNVFMDEQLFTILDLLLKNPLTEKIVLREHPAFPLNIPAEKIPDRVVFTGSNTSLWDDAQQCDVIIGGNSSFHLSALKFGIPTVFYDALDFVKYDDYGFIKHDILFEVKELDELDYKVVAQYYSEPDWENRFRYFDAGYKRDESLLREKVQDTILNTILNEKA